MLLLASLAGSTGRLESLILSFSLPMHVYVYMYAGFSAVFFYLTWMGAPFRWLNTVHVAWCSFLLPDLDGSPISVA